MEGLNLDEMLALANKVEEWQCRSPHDEINSYGEYFGLVDCFEVSINLDSLFATKKYNLKVSSENILLGENNEKPYGAKRSCYENAREDYERNRIQKAETLIEKAKLLVNE